jgi:hypothetical protein
MSRFSLCLFVALALSAAALAKADAQTPTRVPSPIPRTADGKPNLQGIWQAPKGAGANLLATRGVVEGNQIPYQPAAAAKQRENLKTRAKTDPLASCFLPGVPRIMYMDWPFQIFQTRDAVAMTFEWTQVHRLIYTNGSKPVQGIEFWMGDSRGRWEGDTLVVDVSNFNDRPWLDATGVFHSEAMHLVERYTMTDANTIRYEATITDPKVFTRPWKINVPLSRRADIDRLLEHQCKALQSEANGAFERDPKTWYPGPEVKK